ncbi:MAG: hypothetical protein LPK07_04395 [Hymenobacteraceae bacterium]|nr:hypothetical protein [Hymenobacteraceae bacterium]
MVGLLAVIIIAFVIGALFYFIFGSRGPWGSFWTFFIVVFLGILLAYVWVRPTGPIYWGVAFFPLLFVGLLFALLLAAASPPSERFKRGPRATRPDDPTLPPKDTPPENGKSILGVFFWTVLILFIALIMAGIYY